MPAGQRTVDFYVPLIWWNYTFHMRSRITNQPKWSMVSMDHTCGFDFLIHGVNQNVRVTNNFGHKNNYWSSGKVAGAMGCWAVTVIWKAGWLSVFFQFKPAFLLMILPYTISLVKFYLDILFAWITCQQFTSSCGRLVSTLLPIFSHAHIHFALGHFIDQYRYDPSSLPQRFAQHIAPF